MAEEIDWNWAKCGVEHPLRMAFNRTMSEVLNAKLSGIGVVPARVRQADLDFLAANHDRLRSAIDSDEYRKTIDKVMGFGKDPVEPDLKAACIKIMRATAETAETKWATRGFLVTQFLAMTAGMWRSPSLAMLYSATQAASHYAFKVCRGQGEVETTVALTSKLLSVLGERFVEPLRHQKIRLPPGDFLDFGTASMQGWRDRLGSDFALVVGTCVRGIPVYRVALFQAKRQGGCGSVNVSQGSGRQLDELLTSGMGYYVFYPTGKNAFVATVRSAESVYSDVNGPSDGPQYRVDICCARDGSDVAWDFVNFVTVAMESPEEGVGKTFPDADAVAEALSTDRKEPLAAHVIFHDRTGLLNVRQLAEGLKERGYEHPQIYEALSSLDVPEEVDEEVPSADWGW